MYYLLQYAFLVMFSCFVFYRSEAENTAVFNLLNGLPDENKRVWIGLERCAGSNRYNYA